MKRKDMSYEPFRAKTLPEERDDRYIIISVRLNPQEQAWLQEIKSDLNIAADGKALKMAAFIGKNVVQNTFGKDFLRYLFNRERSKLDK